MKRLRLAVPAAFLCIGVLAGCGESLEADSGIVYVKKDSTVIALDVEEFEQSYYDEEELKAFIESAVAEYNASNESDSIEVQNVSVEDNKAKMKLKYKTAKDYTQFYHTVFYEAELYEGTVKDALAAGYDFETEFTKVGENETLNIDKNEILAQEDLKAVILKAETDLKVDGTIVYVSSENVAVTGKNTASVKKIIKAEETEQIEETLEEDTQEELFEEEESAFVMGEIVFDMDGTRSDDIIADLYESSSEVNNYAYIIYK